MNSSTVIVHGATGTQGAAIVRGLLSAGHRVRGIVRDTSTSRLHPDAEPVRADLLDAGSLAAVYRGVDAVIVQLPLVFAADPAIRQARAALAGLREAGVRQAIFNAGSVVPREAVGVPFVDARVLVSAELSRSAGVATVVAPAHTYMENLSAPWSSPLVRAGEVAYPLPRELPVPWVALDDLGAAVAALITSKAPPPLQIVAGPRTLTGDEVAAELTAALGHSVRWNSITPAAYERMLAPHLGAEAAEGIAGAYTPPPPGTPPSPGPDPAVVTPGATTVRDWAARQDWPAHVGAVEA
ncbi:NmrA family NAD(P)-binding protein [Streptomyces gardneri]|uniref:NmrA family NAD(P)-binding protein n=1 Tax=Nocardia TaxID=1817 RepID=UPI001358DBEA|nr:MULTISPECIES: NmrA family NAD(P)-binding protein [Nocardia]MBF6165943.1 NmrA family NAD(P)-binding protein [Streptomyces gardneri]